MLTCVPSTVLAQGAGFEDLSETDQLLCKIGLLLQHPANVGQTPNSTLAAGADFQRLSDNERDLVEIQLWINLVPC